MQENSPSKKSRLFAAPQGQLEFPEEDTEGFWVDDSGIRYVIIIRRVDFRPDRTPMRTGVVRFTKKTDAPAQTGNILLRTSEFYRTLGGDQLDGAQTADITPMMVANLRESIGEVTISAEATYTAEAEPWIFCTSMEPRDAIQAEKLKKIFSNKGPDAVVTIIDDPDAFARQIGIDAARSAKSKSSVKESGLDFLSRYLWEVAMMGCNKKVVLARVYHGPVNYENVELKMKSADDLPSAERIWFTKRIEFSDEREYRFAISLAGCPRIDTLALNVSPELSKQISFADVGTLWYEEKGA